MKEITESGYEGLVESFGVEIVFSEHDNDYQGDSYYLLRDGDRYGTLVFGWGSCSGCDAYEAAWNWNGDDYNTPDLLALRDSLWSDVKWFDSVDEVRKYAFETDFKQDWYYYRDAGKRFIERLREL